MIEPHNTESMKLISNYTVVDFNPFTIQLAFENPLYITTAGSDEMDWLEIIILSPRLFVSKSTGLPVEQTYLIAPLPS